MWMYVHVSYWFIPACFVNSLPTSLKGDIALFKWSRVIINFNYLLLYVQQRLSTFYNSHIVRHSIVLKYLNLIVLSIEPNRKKYTDFKIRFMKEGNPLKSLWLMIINFYFNRILYQSTYAFLIIRLRELDVFFTKL